VQVIVANTSREIISDCALFAVLDVSGE